MSEPASPPATEQPSAKNRRGYRCRCAEGADGEQRVGRRKYAGGAGSSRAVLVAGLAEAYTGVLSVGAGEFIGARSEAQAQQTEIARELEEMRRHRDAERREMEALLVHEGVAPDDAARMVAVLVRYPDAYRKTMVEKELCLQLETGAVKVPGR